MIKKNSYTSYKDLEVWQKSMDLVVDCYQVTKVSQKETFGVIQLTVAAKRRSKRNSYSLYQHNRANHPFHIRYKLRQTRF